MLPTPRRSAQRLRRSTLAFALVAAGLYLWTAGHLRPATTLWGDEPTYLAMAESLARDGDLRFTASDRRWVEERQPGALILQRAGERLAYSKPILYPLLASPLVGLVGEPGMRWLNLLALAGALLLAWDRLHRFGDRIGARATWLTFVVASPIVPYALWRMTESVQLALSLAGLVLATSGLRPGRSGGTAGTAELARILAGGALLGLLISLRLPNLLIAFAPVAAWAVARRPRVAAQLAAAVVVSYTAVAALTFALTGAPDPYRAVRTSFDARTGFPATGDALTTEPVPAAPQPTPDAAPSGDRFATDPATHRAYWRTAPQIARSLYSGLYALCGRHTGLLIYFPALWILLPALRRSDGVALCLLTAAAGLFAFYLLWLPGNYFGGSTFIGNRYWLAAYPLLLVALPRLPSSRTFFVGWMVTIAIGASAALGVASTPEGSIDSQAHATRGLFRRLPAESTAAAIDGWTPRRWAGEVVRVVDRRAELGPDDLRLRGDRGATELLVPTPEPYDFVFIATAEASGELEIRDWRRRERYPLDAARATLVRFAGSRPWRHHPTLPDTDRYVAALRLRFLPASPAPAGATATLRYVGDPSRVGRPVARRVRKLTLPDGGVAGATSEAWIAVRNESEWSWAPDAPLPISLRYRLIAADVGETVHEGPPLPLPETIPPGGALRMPFTIRWPDRPGRYDLVLDLEESHVGAFAARVGEPLSTTPVVVRAAVEGPTDAAITP